MVESTKKVQAQNISCPEVVWTTPNPMDLGCDIADTCFTLNASLPDIRQTLNGPNAYVVNEIPYSGNFGYNLAGATNVLVNIDDKFSSAVNLPFPFCFYGTTYHQIVIGANGRVTFDMSRANMTDQWSIGTNASLPSLNAPFTRATIYGPFHDMDPSIYSSNKTINWKVIDEAPCRKMIITYRDIPHFGTFCTNSRSTFQIVLYENTNAIEIYIDEKPACTGWNNGRSIIGIQNWQGTQATVVPGQNPGVQNLSQKAYRFVPNGPSLLSGNIELLDFNDNVIQSVPNPGGANGEINVSFPNVCYDLNGPTEQDFKVRAVYQACSGNDITVLDTLTVIKPDLVPNPITETPLTYCLNATAQPLEATPLAGHTLSWYDENQAPLTPPIVPSTHTVGTTTYYVSQSSGTCESDLVPIEVIVLPGVNEDITLDLCRSHLPLDTLGQTITHNQQTNLTNPFSTITYTGSQGCDSIVDYFLNIIENDTTVISEVVCENELPYHFYGQSLSSAGIYNHVILNSAGCDSVVTLNLAVDPYITHTLTETICEGEDYVFNGVTYTSPVTLQDNITDTFATAGCDSIVTLVLNVNPIAETMLNETICESETFSFGGQTLTSAGTFTDTLQTSLGCDSIITLVLEVNPVEATTLNESICEGETFSFGGQVLSTSGSYVDTLQTTLGCDSIVTLNLTVDPYLTSVLEATICEGEDYVFNGVTYTSSVTLQDNISDTFATAGCDSIVTLVLNVNPIEATTLNEIICEYETFSFGGQTLSSAGTYIDTFQTALGCDSIVTLNLIVDPFITSTLEATICEGEDYVFNGVTYTSSVTLQDNITDTFATAGCDSIVTFVLSVNPIADTTLNESICEGETFSFGGQVLSTSGTYVDTLQTTLGCDSIVTLNLTVDPYLTSVLEATICEGEDYVFNGVTYTSPVTLQDNISDTFATAGCDSIVTLVLNVNPIEATTLNESICVGQTFSFGGQVLSTSGTYVDTFQTTLGCDSIVTLNLTVDPYITHTLTENICDGDSYIFNGVTYTSPVTLQDNITDTFATAGCDSIVTLVLNVNPIEATTLNEIICEYETFSFGGQTLSSAGTYIDTFQTALGCDSIVTLNLIVDPFITSTLEATICEGEDYVFNGVAYTSSVTLQDNITDTFATAGCDSIVTFVLSVNPIADTTLNESICVGQTFSFGGQVLSTSGTYVDTLQTALGCDSIVTLNLTVDPYLTSVLEATICEGEDYVFNGVTYTSAVTLQDNITDTFATAGCDSIVTLVLNVNPIEATTLNESICVGQTFSFGGQVLSTSGTYVDTFQTTLGCDSIVTLNLTVDPYITHTLTENICDGDSYIFNGVTYTSPVTLQDNITDTFATAGCDSIVTLVLNVNPVYHETEELTLCESALPYVWNGINIPIGTVSQNNFDSLVLTTQFGCDSTIYLNLNIHDTFQAHETITMCPSDLPFTWHQHTFSTQTGPGVYTETASYQTVNGCDSSYFLTLNIHENYDVVVDTTICKENLPFVWHGYTFNDEGSTFINPEVVLQTINGCDSILTLHVNLYPDAEVTSIYEAGCGVVVFEGNTYDQSSSFTDTLYNLSGCDSLIRNIDIVVYPSYAERKVVSLQNCDSVIYEGQAYYTSVQLLDTLNTIQGCDSIITEVNINIDNFELYLSTTYDTIFRGESVLLETYGSTSYNVLNWTPTHLFSLQNATSQYLALDNHVNVEVVAEGVNGCSDTASLYLHVKYFNKKVFIPNSFTPNYDGLNDLFGPELPIDRGYRINNFSIYNRYGERMFFHEGETNKKWDGKLRGVPMDVGVYFYVLEVSFQDGDTFEAVGEVNLIR